MFFSDYDKKTISLFERHDGKLIVPEATSIAPSFESLEQQLFFSENNPIKNNLIKMIECSLVCKSIPIENSYVIKNHHMYQSLSYTENYFIKSIYPFVTLIFILNIFKIIKIQCKNILSNKKKMKKKIDKSKIKVKKNFDMIRFKFEFPSDNPTVELDKRKIINHEFEHQTFRILQPLFLK